MSDYVPALRFHAFTRFYDWVVAWSSAESEFRPAVVELVEEVPESVVVDLACGTGTLTWMLGRRFPRARVVGVDLDERALGLARSKFAGGEGTIAFERADARALPFADASVTCVVACLFFHHLAAAEKLRVLGEVRRVLRPGGQLVLADWGPPHSRFAAVRFLAVRLLDGMARTLDHTSDAFEWRLREAGFVGVEERHMFRAAVGTIRVWTARAGA